MANRGQQGTFRTGTPVRIIACPQNHPEHVGQVGTVAPDKRQVGVTRVYVGLGICQAAAVEIVDEPPVVRGTSAGVLSDHMPPGYR